MRRHILNVLLASCVAFATFTTAGDATAPTAQPPVAIGIATNPPVNVALDAQYTTLVGAPPKIIMWFRDFSAPLFYSTELRDVRSIGADPMVTWDPAVGSSPIPFASIVAGKYDSYVRAQALAARATGTTVYIRLAHEMNVTSRATPWGPGASGNTPASFVAAWIHIVTLFRQSGATNVRWVWAPNVDCNGQCPFTAYYPGDQWVDDVGLDGYNFGSVHQVPWQSLAQIFGPSYRLITQLTAKPVMFTEVASTEAGGNKAQWITQGFLHDIPSLFPRVVAVIWWQRVDETDWRVNSSGSALAAWRAVAQSPYYGAAARSAAALRIPVPVPLQHARSASVRVSRPAARLALSVSRVLFLLKAGLPR